MNNAQINLNDKIVVVNCITPELLNNKLFEPGEAAKISHTILPMCYLQQQALQKGIKFITSDIFLQLPQKPKNVLLMSHLVSPDTIDAIKAGAKPAILTCQESPFVAGRFYVGLKKYSSWFKHSFLFSGMKKNG